VAVTGLSPQIVCETLYALAMREPPFYVGEMHVLTTEEGAERIRLQLLGADGQLARLQADYALPPLTFSMAQVHIVEAASGCLQDIHSAEDNAAVGDAACELLRTLTLDEHSALHVSIAGGRKTMGFYIGYALSLFARPQDALSHVLVTPSYESLPDFFYPAPVSRTVYDREGNPLDAAKATVILADIPFVRLRERMPEALRSGRHSFSETIAVTQHALEATSLHIHRQRRVLRCNGYETKRIAPLPFTFYCWLAEVHRRGNTQGQHWRQADAQSFLDCYRRLHGETGNFQRIEARFCPNAQGKLMFERQQWLEYVGSSNRALDKALGETHAKPFHIVTRSERPHTCYGLNLPPTAIEFVED